MSARAQTVSHNVGTNCAARRLPSHQGGLDGNAGRGALGRCDCGVRRAVAPPPPARYSRKLCALYVLQLCVCVVEGVTWQEACPQAKGADGALTCRGARMKWAGGGERDTREGGEPRGCRHTVGRARARVGQAANNQLMRRSGMDRCGAAAAGARRQIMPAHERGQSGERSLAPVPVQPRKCEPAARGGSVVLYEKGTGAVVMRLLGARGRPGACRLRQPSGQLGPWAPGARRAPRTGPAAPAAASRALRGAAAEQQPEALYAAVGEPRGI
jgi:hypothetical protein